MKLEAFSYSRLTGYEVCPRKHFKLNIDKSVREEPNEHTTYGTEVHLAFANRVAKGTPLPLHLRQHETMLKALAGAPGDKIVEQKIAINHELKGTDWFAKDVYCRVISDLTILNAPFGVVIDWKTGRPYDDFTQLKLVGSVVFWLAPEIQNIRLSYVWTKTKSITSENMARADVLPFWTGLQPRLKAYQEAHEKREFPPKPGPHCRWCPDKSCPFYERRK